MNMSDNIDYMKEYGMSEEEYLKEYYNKVDNLTAVCRNTIEWQHGEYDDMFKLERDIASFDKIRIIHGHLRDIETKYHVRILLAVESGSRAWGFDSLDSDWDVRFIYVHEPEWYFSIKDHKDTIDIMYRDDVDASGWELRKALRLFKQSNPSFFEWLNSPVIYKKDELFLKRIKAFEERCFNADKAMYHYNHIYKKHNDCYITENGLPLKRFLYYLRGILVCKWLTDYNTVPPVRFSTLVNATIANPDIKEKINILLEKKRRSKEYNSQSVDESLFAWAQQQAEYYDKIIETLHVSKKSESDTELDKLMYETVYEKGESNQYFADKK